MALFAKAVFFIVMWLAVGKDFVEIDLFSDKAAKEKISESNDFDYDNYRIKLALCDPGLRQCSKEILVPVASVQLAQATSDAKNGVVNTYIKITIKDSGRGLVKKIANDAFFNQSSMSVLYCNNEIAANFRVMQEDAEFEHLEFNVDGYVSEAVNLSHVLCKSARRND